MRFFYPYLWGKMRLHTSKALLVCKFLMSLPFVVRAPEMQFPEPFQDVFFFYYLNSFILGTSCGRYNIHQFSLAPWHFYAPSLPIHWFSVWTDNSLTFQTRQLAWIYDYFRWKRLISGWILGLHNVHKWTCKMLVMQNKW